MFLVKINVPQLIFDSTKKGNAVLFFLFIYIFFMYCKKKRKKIDYEKLEIIYTHFLFMPVKMSLRIRKKTAFKHTRCVVPIGLDFKTRKQFLPCDSSLPLNVHVGFAHLSSVEWYKTIIR